MEQLRIKSKSLSSLVKEKVPSFEVPDTSKLNLDQLLDLIDQAIWNYLSNYDDIKHNDRILALYKHLLVVFEHHKNRRGWIY